jgi:hypothetical protein
MTNSTAPGTTAIEPSQLFTVRAWEEATRAGEANLRLRVEHVRSGETRHFYDWSEAAAFMADKLRSESTDEGRR